MGAHNIYDIVANTSIIVRQQAISSRLIYKIKTNYSCTGRVVIQAWGQVIERLRGNVPQFE